MFAPRIRGALVVSLGVMLTACGGSTEPSGPSQTASAVVKVSGDEQAGVIGSALSVPLVVKVTSAVGSLRGATVNFAVTSGTASLSPTTATTDTSGEAKTVVTLGSTAGTVIVAATVSGTSLSTTFTLTAGTSVVSSACSTGSAATVALGGVVPATGTGICISGGASGSEYGLVAFYANSDSAATRSITVKSTGGVTGLATASVAPAFNTTLGASGGTLGRPLATNAAQSAFDAKLRDVAHRQLASKISFARNVSRQHAAFTAIPANPTVGTIYTLNAQGDSACSAPINIGARVVAVSSKAIVVADTANPSGGFTDTDYANFAAQFDTLIFPLDVQNFGAPSDIDNNGKIIIFFTKEVNKLTPKTGTGGGYIGGFFFERDLFPATSTPDLQGCPTSNYAEMYYSLVPDPNAVFSIAHTTTDVLDVTPATLAHEFQHLINAGRRIYVNNADNFEDTWLNEGLSHIAEELLFYQQAGLAPRQNISASVFTTQALVDAFNNDQSDNTGRYETYLQGKTTTTSPYGGDDSLQTRGATWNLLRYLADHRNATDADTWFKLVNSTTSGQPNLANVFGSDYLNQINNWAVSVFADDLTGQNDPTYSQPSWNYRSIFPRLQGNSSIYPLTVFPVSDASPHTTSLVGGGAAYFRFAVPAGATASIDWTSAGLPVSSLMKFTLVRTK